MLKEFQINHKTIVDNYNSKEKNILILISLLHINKLINNNSIKSLFKNLREGKLLRNVGTYHSNINDKWYNDESIFEIYEDILDSMKNPKGKERLRIERINKLRRINGLPKIEFKESLNFEETLKYLNLYLNKNRNYCIDYLFHEYIKPAINSYSTYNKDIKKMFNYDFSIFEKSDHSYDINDYCCEYCCGDYNDWLSYNSYRKEESEIKNAKEDIINLVNKFLNDKREKYKGSYKEFTI